jgi:hypothetical protein
MDQQGDADENGSNSVRFSLLACLLFVLARRAEEGGRGRGRGGSVFGSIFTSVDHRRPGRGRYRKRAGKSETSTKAFESSRRRSSAKKIQEVTSISSRFQSLSL